MRFLIATALFVSTGFVYGADDPNAIIDKAIKALGGEEKLSEGAAEQWKAKGTMNVMGMSMPYTGTYTFMKPDKFKFEVEAEFGGQKVGSTASTDGKDTWQSAFGMVEAMPDKKAKAFHHTVFTMSLQQVVPLKDKRLTLAMVDEIKLDGKPAVGIKVSKKDHADVTLYFDKATGLPVKSQTMMWDEFTDKDVTQEAFIIEWKELDGRKTFQKLLVKRDGKTLLEEEFSDQKVLEKLDLKVFAKPEEKK